MCDADLDTGTTMNKKIRNSQLAQYNFILGMPYNNFIVFSKFNTKDTNDKILWIGIYWRCKYLVHFSIWTILFSAFRSRHKKYCISIENTGSEL